MRPEPFAGPLWTADRARKFANELVDLWLAHLARLEGAHAVPPPFDPALIFDAPLSDAELVGHLAQIAQHSTLNGHGARLGYVASSGAIPGAATALLAAGLNQNTGAHALGPVLSQLERQLVGEFAERFGLSGGGGVFTSGGAAAATMALQLARDLRAGWDVKTEGLHEGPPLRIYVSDQAHVVHARAAAQLGLGTRALVKVPTTKSLRLDVPRLKKMIDADVAAERKPIAVVGSAGTTATGAIDPLSDIADLCDELDLWFHVDASYGGVAAWLPDLQPSFTGIDRAHSIAFDPHKWLGVAPPSGALIVRDVRHLRQTYGFRPSYVPRGEGKAPSLGAFGPEFTRAFRALEVWATLASSGWAQFLARVRHDLALAGYLRRQVELRENVEVLASGLSVVCFRYVPKSVPRGPKRRGLLNQLNKDLLSAVQRDGRVFPSNANVFGQFCLRACITTVRTEADEIDLLMDVVCELGDELWRHSVSSGTGFGPRSTTC